MWHTVEADATEVLVMSTPTQQPIPLTSDQAQIVTMDPADELLDPQRHKLIMQLFHIIGEPLVNSTAWACLWFADISSIRDLLEGCGLNVATKLAINHSFGSERFNEMIKACKLLD